MISLSFRSNKNLLLLPVLSLCLFLAGCIGSLDIGGIGVTAPDQRRTLASTIADSGGLSDWRIETDEFTLQSYTRFSSDVDDLVVYLEGDGFAYINRRRISSNPTPRNPLALRLAAIDPAPAVAWIARPCQYSLAPVPPAPCQRLHWTTSRFSEEIVVAVDQAMDQVVERSGAKRIHLVGYSGGGAIGVLLAARRDDVVSLRTVAGNVDHDMLMQVKRVAPLSGSLNPVLVAGDIANLPQYHFAGEDDEIVPPWVAQRFIEFTGRTCASARLVEDTDHQDGWVEFWQQAAPLLPSC